MAIGSGAFGLPQENMQRNTKREKTHALRIIYKPQLYIQVLWD